MFGVLSALGEEAARVAAFLGSVSEEDWMRPTRCPPMRVLELAVHVLLGGVRIREMLEAGAVDAEPEKDALTNYAYDRAAVAGGVVERAFEAAEGTTGAEVAKAWEAEWAASLGAARAALARDDPVLPGVFGLMRLSEYLRTRCVEMVIHHMDLRDAFGLLPDPDPAALDVACGVAAGLLGTDPRALGIDPVRFALIGTGRAALDDTERRILGPLAERFPLIS